MFKKLKVWLRVAYRLAKNPNLFCFAVRAWFFMGRQSYSEVLFSILNKKRQHHRESNLKVLKQIQKRVKLVNLLAMLHHSQPRCLVKTLILAQWMQKMNLDFELKIGWGKNDIAHSWIEFEGEIIDSAENQPHDYAELKKIAS